MESTVEILPSVRSMVTEDGAVLLDIRQGLMFTLNPTGGVIWSLIQRGLRRAEIIGEVCARFGISEEEADTDLSAFLAGLRKHGVAEIHGDD